MTNPQKLILTLLSALALLILASLCGLVAFLLIQTPAPEAVSAPEAVAQAATPTSSATPSSTPVPLPQATATPTEPLAPTPTSTRVVVVTIFPTASPTPANCINNITNFETSDLLTNEQIQLYLQETIPPTHLDHCRVIEYQPRTVSAHATPVTGSFTPMFRQIYVYATGGEFQTPATLLDTLTHEIGHNVHYNIRRDNWDSAARWTELYKQSQNLFAREGLGFVSDYARFNDFEDFAETYRAYIRDPELLKFVNPAKYDYMREVVFNGREY